MSNVVQLRTQRVEPDSPRATLRSAMSVDERAFEARAFDLYFDKRRVAVNHARKGVESDRRLVTRFLDYVDKVAWACTEDDFDSFAAYVGTELKLAVSTQRKYQGAVAGFFEYCLRNVGLQSDARRLYAGEFKLIGHTFNRIAHTVEREGTKARQALSHVEFGKLMDTCDEAILEAHSRFPKRLKSLQRDKVMIYTQYIFGLRPTEMLTLNIASFMPAVWLPSMGQFALVNVWGKGAKGSGPRHRCVPCTSSDLPPLLEWYLSQVRPRFLKRGAPETDVLFLSQQGKRPGISGYEKRFAELVVRAGLDASEFVPHSLRHTSVSHEALRAPLSYNRDKHGHVNASTTQIYTHIPESFVRATTQRLAAQMLDDI